MQLSKHFTLEEFDNDSFVISFEDTIPCSNNFTSLSNTNFEFFIYLYNNLLYLYLIFII